MRLRVRQPEEKLGRNKVSGGRVGEGKGGELGPQGLFQGAPEERSMDGMWKGMGSQHGDLQRGRDLVQVAGEEGLQGASPVQGNRHAMFPLCVGNQVQPCWVISK